MSVPARKVNDQCPACLSRKLALAPRNCVRCGMEEAEQLGFSVYNLTEMSSWTDADEWAQVIRDFDAGWIMPSGFYLYVAHRGGRLSQPMQSLLDAQPETNLGYSSMTLAVLAARNAVSMYSQVWVVTALGAWMVENTDI